MTPARDRDVDQAVARGSEQLKRGELAEAQQTFKDAYAIDPGSVRVLALLGLTYFRAGQFALAQPIYEELVERAPSDASHRLNLGLVYLKLNDAEHAIMALEASRALDPAAGRAVSYLGLAYARAGRYTEAYRSFLLANQNDLAIEIEANLTAAERELIHTQLRRTPAGPFAAVQPPADTPEAAIASVASAAIPAPAETPTPAPDRDHSGPLELGKRDDLDDLDELGDFSVETPAAAIPIPTAARDSERATAPTAVPSLPGRDLAHPRRDSAPPNTMRVTDSMQFVLPTQPPAGGVIQPHVPRAPSIADSPTAPQPLSELATADLVRPDDSDDAHAFEIAPTGALIIRVTERVLARLDGIHVTGGDLTFEPAMRRSRGAQTDEPFDHGGTALHTVTGHGWLLALPDDRTFTAVSLDDDILYVREDLVFAFEAKLRWENGNVPGLRGKLPVVQFRGDGAVAIRLARPLVRVKLPAQGVLFVEVSALAGWIGRVVPRAVMPPPGGPMAGVCVECTGEGVVLVDPPVRKPAVPVAMTAATPPTTPEPSAPAAEAALAAADPDVLGLMLDE